jgi:hypothetical protein
VAEYRHVVSAGVRDTMVTRGWSLADGRSGVVACVPTL